MAEARQQYFESREFHESRKRRRHSTCRHSSLDAASARARCYRLSRRQARRDWGTQARGRQRPPGVEVGPDYAGTLARSRCRRARRAWQPQERRVAAVGEDWAISTRRQDEWDLQIELAGIELKQIDSADWRPPRSASPSPSASSHNHDLQIEHSPRSRRVHARQVHERGSLQLDGGPDVGAVLPDLSARVRHGPTRRSDAWRSSSASRTARAPYIRFGYWDSLKKGLLAGDQLAHDLKRLELAHLEKNVREYELTKHVSLATLDPLAFIALKETGQVRALTIPESLFDLDTPGHYLRRLKSVSVTIPCVTGPYTGVHCTLRLVSNEIRCGPDGAGDRATDTRESGPTIRGSSSIARIRRSDRDQQRARTTAACSRPVMRDERYLPFEGAGAVSTWSLELPADVQVVRLRHHLRRHPAPALHGARRRTCPQDTGCRGDAGAAGGRPPRTCRDTRQRRRAARAARQPAPRVPDRVVSLCQRQRRRAVHPHGGRRPGPFPVFAQRREITIRKATVIARSGAGAVIEAGIAPGPAPSTDSSGAWEGTAAPGPWTLSTTVSPGSIDEAFVVLEYGTA